MNKHSRIKLMRRKKKLFPWLRTFYSKYSEKFFSAENIDIFEYLFLNVEKEMKDIYSGLNEEKSEDFFNILNSLFLHFCWQIHWSSSKKWKIYWKKGKTTDVSTKDSHRKCCVLLLHYMILLSIFLTGGDEKSDWIGRILTAMKSLPDAADILCSALLLTSDLKKKHKPVYSIILKHTLCCDSVKKTLDPETYCKVILLFRRLLKLTKDKKEKAHILFFATKLEVPSDIQNWLSSQNIDDYKDLNYVDNLTQELLSRSYPDELLRKLSEILTEASFCKKSLTLDTIDNIPSNVISKDSISEGSNEELGEDLESFDKTHSQNGLDDIKTTKSCIAAENLSNDVNNRIKDINKEVQNPIEEMSGETNINHSSKPLQKALKTQKLENIKNKSDSLKKKKAKTLKESSKKHKKNKKKSKETPVTTDLKISDEFETCSKLNVPALDMNECKSNVPLKDLNSELNEGLLESYLFWTTTPCTAAEIFSSDVNNRIKDIINKEVQNPIEEMSGETINHSSVPLQKALKTQKLESVKNKSDSHKKKKAKTSKESSKKPKKSKKKSKETPVQTSLKISDEFETCSEPNVPALDIDECPSNVTSKDLNSVLGDLNSELDKDLLESLDKNSIQNDMNGVEAITSSTVAENTSNDNNNFIRNKTKVVLNPIEGMSGETNVNQSLKTYRKLKTKESEKSKTKKKKKDKILKEGENSKTKKTKKNKILKELSKKHKKNKKKSKEKPEKNTVKTNEKFEPKSELSVDINVAKDNKASKKRKLENEESEKRNNKKKKKEKLVKDSAKDYEKKEKRLKDSAKDLKKKKSKEKRSNNALNIGEEFKTCSKINVPASDIDIPSNFSSNENVSEDLYEAFLKSNASDMQNDLNGAEATASCITAENTSTDVNNTIKNKDLHNVVAIPLEGTCSESSLENTSKKQKLEKEDNERRNHKKKKKDKVLKQSSKTRKKNKKKSKEKSDKNNEFETPCNESNSQKHKKSKKKANKTAVEINRELEIYPQLGLATSHVKEPHQSKNSLNNEIENSSKQHNHSLNSGRKRSKSTSNVGESHDFENSSDLKKISHEQQDYNIKTKRKRSKSMSNVRESHDFENPLDLKEISNEQQDYNIKTKRKRSKSENEKKEQSHSKKSKKQSHEKQVTRYKEVTGFGLPDTILPDKNFSESENSLPRIKNKIQEAMKKHSKEKLQVPTEFLKTAAFDNRDTIISINNFYNPENSQYVCSINASESRKSKKKDKLKEMSEKENSFDSISKGNCYKSSLIKENIIDEPKELPKVKRKKLFNNDLYCLNTSQKEIQTSTTITNNCIVPMTLSPSKRHSFLDNNDTIDMRSENLDVDSSFSSSEETTAFSDVSMSDVLNFPKVDIYRHNAALGIVNNPTLKNKRKKKPNSNIEEQNKELSVLKSDLLMANEKILQQNYISETLKSQIFIDNESGAEETEQDNNESTKTLSFCNANKKESVVGSDFVDGNNVSKKCTSTPVLISKQSNEAKSTAFFQQSQFMDNAGDTFLTTDCSSGQNFEAGIKVQTVSEQSFCSFSHSTLNPSVMLKDVLPSKSSQKSVSSSEKSFKSISESYISETKSSTSPQTDTNLGIGVSHELTSETMRKSTAFFQQSQFMDNAEDTFLTEDCSSGQNFEANIKVQTASNVLKDVLPSKSSQKSVSSSEKSFASISESYISETQSNTPPRTDTNLEIGVSHELTSENIAKANELYGEKEGTLMDLFCANMKSSSPCVENVSVIPTDDNLNHNTVLSEFQSPSLIQASNIFLNESKLFATSVSQSQLNTFVTKNQTEDCGTQYISTENVDHKSVSTATEIINSNNVADNCNNGNSIEISNNVSSVQVTINFSGNEDCPESKKQFVAHFDFQTVNDVERTPLISSISFSPANASTPMINYNHNPNLGSTKNHDPLHIIQFNQTTNPIEKSVNSNRCSDANFSHKPEKIEQCVALNDSGLSQILCSKSSPTIVNNSNNTTQCHPRLFSNAVALNSARKDFSHSSFSKNKNPLSLDGGFKFLSTENLDSLNGESNELSLKAKVENNDSSFRSSTIYSDESDDSSSLSSASNYLDFETEVSDGETIKVRASSEPAVLNKEKNSYCKNDDPLLQERNNDISHIYSGQSDDREQREAGKQRVAAGKTRTSKYKSCRIIEFDSDYSNPESPLMPKPEPDKIGKTKSKECSNEDSSLSKCTSNKRKTPVNNRKTRSSSEHFSKDSSLSKSTYNKEITPEKNVSTVENLDSKSKYWSEELSTLIKSTFNERKAPEENVSPVNNRYNLRARKALQTRQLFGIEIEPSSSSK